MDNLIERPQHLQDLNQLAVHAAKELLLQPFFTLHTQFAVGVGLVDRLKIVIGA